MFVFYNKVIIKLFCILEFYLCYPSLFSVVSQHVFFSASYYQKLQGITTEKELSFF